jgi:hypothetical protein
MTSQPNTTATAAYAKIAAEFAANIAELDTLVAHADPRVYVLQFQDENGEAGLCLKVDAAGTSTVTGARFATVFPRPRALRLAPLVRNGAGHGTKVVFLVDALRSERARAVECLESIRQAAASVGAEV